MDSLENEHIVEFDKYCPTCKYEKVYQAKNPCNICLSIPARENSRKPEKWEAKE